MHAKQLKNDRNLGPRSVKYNEKGLVLTYAQQLLLGVNKQSHIEEVAEELLEPSVVEISLIDPVAKGIWKKGNRESYSIDIEAANFVNVPIEQANQNESNERSSLEESHA